MSNTKDLIAVGLRESFYSQDFKISVRGLNDSANKIVQLAKKFNVPIVRSPKLGKLLSEIPSDQKIPEKLMPALALILENIK